MNTKDVILIACAFMLGIVVSNLFFKRKYDCTYKVITNVDTLYVLKVDTIFQSKTPTYEYTHTYVQSTTRRT